MFKYCSFNYFITAESRANYNITIINKWSRFLELFFKKFSYITLGWILEL